MATRKSAVAAKKPVPKTTKQTTRRAGTASARKAVAKRAPEPAARAARRRRRQPETLRLRAVTAGLTVNDITRSVGWYRDVLGFIVADEWRDHGVLRGAEMRAGTVTIFLGQDDWKKGMNRVKGEGFRLYCQTAQNVDHLAALIRKRGGVLTHEPQTQPWGERDFGIVDPDGFKITITTGS